MGSLGHVLWIAATALLVVAGLRPARDALRGLGPAPFLVAFAAVAANVSLLPPSDYVPGGHEGLYHLLAQGEPVDPAAEGPWATLPLPTALAATVGLIGGRAGELLWLLLGRAGLVVAVLAVGAAAAEVAPADRGRSARVAAGVAAAFVASDPNLHAWAATGFFVAPATAAAAVALALGVRGSTSLALGWGAVAVGSRLETLPIAAVAVLASAIVGRTGTAAPAARIGAGLALFGAAGMVLRGRPPVEGGPTVWDVAAANLVVPGLALPIWIAAPTATLLLWGWLSDAGPRLDPARRRGALTLALGAAGVLGSLLGLAPLVDGGARHLLPAMATLAVMLGVATARIGRPAVAAAFLLWMGTVQAVGFQLLVPTHSARGGDPPPLEAPTLDRAALRACTLLVEGPAGPGVAPFSGAEVVEARGADCVAVDVSDAHVFRGDARAERLARARALFGLRPVRVDGRLVWAPAPERP